MNNPFEYIASGACRRAARLLMDRIEEMRGSGDEEDAAFLRELDGGKMLGVLIAADEAGNQQTLYAFSGQIGAYGFQRDGFVGPVFDYLQPGGYFKIQERKISQRNLEIAEFERGEVAVVKEEYQRINGEQNDRIAECRESYRIAKLKRDERRESGLADAAELAAMASQSQYEKGELRRLKQRLGREIEPYQMAVNLAASRLEEMKRERREESEMLQQWLFDNFKLLNARGELRSLNDIFAATPLRVPPSGAGECCAPKLLQEVFRRGWQPLEIAEFWYGQGKSGEVRRHGDFYPACRGKCRPVLEWMMQGLEVEPALGAERYGAEMGEPEILFENEWFCVVSKPCGMLSVPGKGMGVSVQEWLSRRYGAGKDVKMAHRLDQDTSGLLIATFGQESYKEMQGLFARREVRKTYVAELDGDYRKMNRAVEGLISLPLTADWLDRPRQRVDMEIGKQAETVYEFLEVTQHGRSRVAFHPLTGRTHQLRVHAASSLGLGMPICGDRLYGRRGANGELTAERLLLHAHRLEFTFTLDGRSYSFESPVPF